MNNGKKNMWNVGTGESVGFLLTKLRLGNKIFNNKKVVGLQILMNYMCKIG